MSSADTERVAFGSVEAALTRGSGEGLAVIVPGAAYPPSAPLLWFGREAIRAGGWSVLSLELAGEDVETLALRLLESATGRFGPVGLVLAKSEGSAAAPMVADAGLPAVWLTPLLDRPPVAEALERSKAPSLVVGAIDDPTWSVRTAARLRNAEVLQLADVDHELQTPGDPSRSLRVLGQVVERVRALVARL